jgi:long-chain acyl-CoA synthetase
MHSRPHLATLVEDMHRLGAQTAAVEHRGVRRFPTTYAQLARGAEWFAAELARYNIAPGERVLLWGENSAAWIACFFGCVMRGVLVVPLDATGTLAFAERIVEETSPRLVAGDTLLLRSLSSQTPQLNLSQISQAMQQTSPRPASFILEALGLDTPLQILFTSGTTGEPKGIVHTHRNLLASLTPIEREIEKYRRYERVFHPLHFLHTLPLSHIFGQFMGLWVAPVLGAVVHYESRLEAPRLLRLLRQERISVLAAVPRVLALMRADLLTTHPALAAELQAAQGTRISKRWWHFRRVHFRLGWRFWAIVCGGATLPEALESFWTTLGIALIQGYGMTETSALVTLNHPFKPARGTLGAPLPGRELRIAETGELLVRGEMVATTTWQHGALRAIDPANGDGWLATGDLTRRDTDGRLHYLGRTGQRLVTSAGLNVYLEDVEGALATQPALDASVAVAIEGQHGQQPAAIVRASSQELAAKAVEAANASLAPHQRIARWWLWPGLDLPRTATGKVRRGVMEAWVHDRLQQEQTEPAAPDRQPRSNSKSTRQDPLLDLIATVTESSTAERTEQLPAAERDLLPLDSLGLDSLARVQLQAALERASGRTIENAPLAAAHTLGDLRRLAGLASELPFPANAGVPHPAVIANEAASPTPGALHQAAPETSTPSPPDEERFLYLRWPWTAPVQLLRTIFLEACVRPLVWLLAGPRITYASPERLSSRQPLLIVANHVSSYDVPLLLYALPAHLRRRVATAAAGEMLEAWRLASTNPVGPAIFWLLTVLFNVFPLPRSHAFRQAFLHAGQALDHGYSVLIFPEGARSHGGPMQPFRGGIGLLAQHAAVQVLPIAMRQSRTRHMRTLRPYAATIYIAQPLTIDPGEEARSITTRLEIALRDLLNQPSP